MSATPALPVAVLISGSGTNLQSLIDSAARTGIRIRAVISDQADAYGLERARRAGIPGLHVDPADCVSREAYDDRLAERIDAAAPDLVLLAGFMRILGPALVGRYSGRMLNIHPSLLPHYRGLHTHRRVLRAGDRQHGCSIHFVTEELDGGPLVAQAVVSVLPDDDEATLSARVQAREHKLYPLIAGWIASGRLRWRNGRVWLDGEPLGHPVVYAEDEEIR